MRSARTNAASMELREQRILLLGAAGTLGNALRNVLEGYDLVAWDADDLRLDDLDRIEPALRRVQPTVVINAAAFTAVDEAEQNEAPAKKINGAAVGAIARTCAALGAKLVQFSTDYVFGGEHPTGYDEEAQPNPLNAYGRSKLLGERLVPASGCDYLLIRTSRLFGHPRETSGVKKNFIQLMIERSTTSSTIEVVDDETASPTYAPDLAEATVALLDDNERGIVHRTNDGSCTWFGFAQEIFSQLKKRVILVPVPSARFPRPAPRPRFSVLHSIKFPPLRRWQEALQMYLLTMANA